MGNEERSTLNCMQSGKIVAHSLICVSGKPCLAWNMFCVSWHTTLLRTTLSDLRSTKARVERKIACKLCATLFPISTQTGMG